VGATWPLRHRPSRSAAVSSYVRRMPRPAQSILEFLETSRRVVYLVRPPGSGCHGGAVPRRCFCSATRALPPPHSHTQLERGATRGVCCVCVPAADDRALAQDEYNTSQFCAACNHRVEACSAREKRCVNSACSVGIINRDLNARLGCITVLQLGRVVFVAGTARCCDRRCGVRACGAPRRA